jgi:hypothetical protein
MTIMSRWPIAVVIAAAGLTATAIAVRARAPSPVGAPCAPSVHHLDRPAPERPRAPREVALSGDGATLVASVVAHRIDHNAAEVYTRTVAGFTLDARLAPPSQHAENGWRYGAAIAISADGTTIAVGAPLLGGAAYVYTRSSERWIQAVRLVPSGVGDDERNGFGTAVALSADGHTLAVGADVGDDVVFAETRHRGAV